MYCISHTYTRRIVLTRHTYIPVLSSFAETMLLLTQPRDVRRMIEKREKKKKTRETQRRYATHSPDTRFTRAVRFGLRYVRTVHACVRHKNNAIAPLPRRALSNYDKTGRARSPERDYVTHTCTHAHIYTRVWRHACARGKRVPETNGGGCGVPFREIRAKINNRRRVEDASFARGNNTRRVRQRSRDLQRSRGPSAFSADVRERSSSPPHEMLSFR